MDAIASSPECLEAMYCVALRMLPIVSFLQGSAITCSLVISGSCSSTILLQASLVDIYILSTAVISFARSNALCSSDLSPIRFKNCLGSSVVERGQSRVPDPPAFISTIILSDYYRLIYFMFYTFETFYVAKSTYGIVIFNEDQKTLGTYFG